MKLPVDSVSRLFRCQLFRSSSPAGQFRRIILGPDEEAMERKEVGKTGTHRSSSPLFFFLLLHLCLFSVIIFGGLLASLKIVHQKQWFVFYQGDLKTGLHWVGG